MNPITQQTGKSLRRMLQERQSKHRVPGVFGGLVRSGGLVWGHSKLLVASNSKTSTAVVVPTSPACRANRWGRLGDAGTARPVDSVTGARACRRESSTRSDRTTAGRETGELLRIASDQTGEIVKVNWATYLVTRQPYAFGEWLPGKVIRLRGRDLDEAGLEP